MVAVVLTNVALTQLPADGSSWLFFLDGDDAAAAAAAATGASTDPVLAAAHRIKRNILGSLISALAGTIIGWIIICVE